MCACDWSWFGHDKTNLGEIVQDDGMHMVGIVVDSDDNNLFAAFDVISCVDIGNSIALDTVVMVYSARSESEAIWNSMHAVHILHSCATEPHATNDLHVMFKICFYFFFLYKIKFTRRYKDN